MFDRLFGDAIKPLYPGSTFTRLSGTLKLYSLKAKNGWSDKSFTTLLEFLGQMLPEGNELPRRTYDAKKILCPMGVDYVKIHACRNDCILFRKDYKELDKCPKCGSSRYKLPKKNSTNSKGVPVKVLWYLPIIPRFKRMFANLKEARNLIWHAGGDGRILDDKIRHPADSTQWKSIDHLFPEFGSDARNLRLGLCTDGMNPFGNLSSQWSTWPVLLTIYNLPPWLCMKRKYLMLSLLISGPKQPGNDIDVYLEPLMDDLKLLWDEGVEVYDAYRGETFNLRAMIFCTINDFPAYGNLSGYTVKGAKACPICEEDTVSDRLVHGGKNVYLCSRRLLHRSHPYRKKMKPFNGKQELRNPPKILSGKEVYEKVKNIENNFGKPYKRSDGTLYKKRSIFWDLPYWKHLSVRHCIDVMHVEKNVSLGVIDTFLGYLDSICDQKCTGSYVQIISQIGYASDKAVTILSKRMKDLKRKFYIAPYYDE
ncbi:uncharacterized protein LOC141639948 [Silene latifolia]|uniref:uncharacterized protein LOC141639948 n=1 Tax=Silene latifolia TaxID=37657 RepID=UPI003D773864